MKTVKKGHHLVACPGAAHSNAHIDHCGLCAPRWGYIEIPVEYATLEAYREAKYRERAGIPTPAPVDETEPTKVVPFLTDAQLPRPSRGSEVA